MNSSICYEFPYFWRSNHQFKYKLLILNFEKTTLQFCHRSNKMLSLRLIYHVFDFAERQRKKEEKFNDCKPYELAKT